MDATNPEFNIGDFISQAGTGSLDCLVNATYNFTWNNSGIVTNAAYRINSSNRQSYRFGNRAYLNSSYFYTFSKSNLKIKPNVGINLQSNSTSNFDGAGVADSNGYNFNSSIGVNVLRKKVGFNTLAFIPIMQNNSNGQTKLQTRFLVGLTFSF